MISLPKNPKIEDLVTVIDQLNTRLTGLEAYVTNNDARIKLLEDRQNQIVLAGYQRIQQLEHSVVREKRKADHLRWMTRRRRRRRGQS